MKNSFLNTIVDFYDFLKHPNEEKDSDQTFLHKASKLFFLLLLELPLMFIVITILNWIENQGWVNTDNHKMVLMFQQMPVWIIAVAGTLVIPLFEEIIFRLYLRFKHNFPFQLIILIASIGGKERKGTVENYLQSAWSRYFKSIIYLSALIFALVHLSNFEYSKEVLFFAPILVAPQFIIGLFLAYLRIRFNLFASYLMHGIHNAIFLVIPLLMIGEGKEKLKIENKDFSLVISEPVLVNTSSSTINTKEISYQSFDMKTIIAYLLETDENSLLSNNPKLAHKKINLEYKNLGKNNEINKGVILSHLSQIYGFTIGRIVKSEEVWEMSIKDSLKLLQHSSFIQENKSTVRVLSNEIQFENVDLDELAHVLSSNLVLNIVNSTGFKGKFNCKLPAKDTMQLRQSILNQYGIGFQSTKREIEYSQINFKE